MSRLFEVFYEFCLYLISFLALPKLLYSLLIKKKYRLSLLARLGWAIPRFNVQQKSIWIHATSVGETKAIVNLALKLKKDFPNHSLIISSTTESGHEEAKQNLLFADYCIFLPFDFRWLIAKVIKKANPFLVILVETDFWYNFLNEAKKNGACICLVNGKMSVNSLMRYKKIYFFSRYIFRLIDLYCVQNELYAERFLKLGIPKNKLRICGNLKLENNPKILSAEEKICFLQKLKIDSKCSIITIGSTHNPEEKKLLEELRKVWQQFPRLKIILVPRHTERVTQVESVLNQLNIAFKKVSEPESINGKEQVILVDKMGLLNDCFQLSTIAIVAGSYVNHIGGHNILEPVRFGIPVIFGPHMHSQLELKGLIENADAGKQVELNVLAVTLIHWLSNREILCAFSNNAFKLSKNLNGSVENTYLALKKLIEN